MGSRKKKSRVAGGDELVAAEMGDVYRSGEFLGTIMKHWRYLYTSYWSMYVAVLGGVHVAVANGYLMHYWLLYLFCRNKEMMKDGMQGL